MTEHTDRYTHTDTNAMVHESKFNGPDQQTGTPKGYPLSHKGEKTQLTGANGSSIEEKEKEGRRKKRLLWP